MAKRKGIGFNCGSRGVHCQKGQSTARLSDLKAGVGRTILKPSDTRSFNREKKKKSCYLERETSAR